MKRYWQLYISGHLVSNGKGLLIVANPLALSLSKGRPFVVRGSTGSPWSHHERTWERT